MYMKDIYLDNLLSIFSSYSYEEILKATQELSLDMQTLLKKAFNDDLKSCYCSDLLTESEKSQLHNLLHNDLPNILLKNQKHSPTKDSDSDIIERITLKRHSRTRIKYNSPKLMDVVSSNGYKKLSREKELNFIKKAKLSYYYDVDEEEQKLYLEYYFEVFPLKKRKYLDIISQMRESEMHIKEKKESNDLTNIDKYRLLLSQLEEKRKRLLDQYIEDSRIYRDRFLKNYYRMILSVVLKLKRWGLPLDDVVEEGAIGLVNALKYFDVESGNRFSTYAKWCIKGKAIKYILKNRTDIPTTHHVAEKDNKIFEISNRLFGTLHRKPTVDELAAETGYSVEEIEKALYYSYYCEVSRFEDFLNRDTGLLICDSLGSIDFDYEKIDEEILVEQLSRLFRLAKLSKAEQAVFIKKYGLEEEIAYSLPEIGRQLGYTTLKVSSIGRSALRKMRNVALTTGFFNYDKINDVLPASVSEDDSMTTIEDTSFQDINSNQETVALKI